MNKGLFITFEGPEGGGKSSQIASLEEKLSGRGFEVILTREPGGTGISEQIRKLIIDPQNSEMLPMTELLLFEAARYQHVHQRIMPALNEGRIVLCDRFYDSSLAYQGARNLPVEVVKNLNELCAAECTPDLTFLLDVDYETGRGRLDKRYQTNGDGLDRIEREKRGFFECLRQNYLELAKGSLGGIKFAGSRRWRVIDASRSAEEVSEEIWKEVFAELSAVRG